MNMNSTTLFLLNICYFFSRYFVSLVAFTITYVWVLLEMGSELAYQTTWVKILGYLSITAWFAWGLKITCQPKFLFACWFLMMGAQAAAFSDYTATNVLLTCVCVVLCLSKLYLTRHRNAAYIVARWA